MRTVYTKVIYKKLTVLCRLKKAAAIAEPAAARPGAQLLSVKTDFR